MKKNYLEKFIFKYIVKEGKFVLRNGQKTNYYCDLKKVAAYPKELKKIIKELKIIVPTGASCIAASGYGGILIGSLLSQELNLPLSLIRNEIKNHGTKQIVDGYIPNKKDKVCIVDDVYTSGSSIKETKDKLKIIGCKFEKSVVVIARGKSKDIKYLFNINL